MSNKKIYVIDTKDMGSSVIASIEHIKTTMLGFYPVCDTAHEEIIHETLKETLPTNINKIELQLTRALKTEYNPHEYQNRRGRRLKNKKR